MTTTRWHWAVAVVLVGMVWFGAPGRADAQNQNTHYRIIVQHSNKCLDVQNVSVFNGTRLQQWDCGPYGQVNQTFNLVPVASGTFRVLPVNSVKCLDVGRLNPGDPASDTYNGAPLQQWDCNTVSAQANQVMQLQYSGIGDFYWIKPTHSGKCLDVANVSQANGALIQQWDCASIAQSNQLWRLEAVGSRVPRHHIQLFGYLDYAPPASMGTHANLTGVFVGEDVPPIINNGGKGYYDVARMGGFFRPGNKADYPAGTSLVQPDWQSRMCGFISNVMGPSASCAATHFPSHVAFFYLQDEPYWNFVDHNGWTINDVHDALQFVAAAIKAKFPNVPIAFVEAVPRLSTMLVPTSVDWVGFDCYGPWTNCQSSTIPGHLATLKSRLQPHHKVMLVPWAVHETNTGPLTQQALDNMHDAANRYVELALSDPQIVALALYKWTSDAGGTALPDIPSLYTRYHFLGRALGFGQ